MPRSRAVPALPPLANVGDATSTLWARIKLAYVRSRKASAKSLAKEFTSVTWCQIRDRITAENWFPARDEFHARQGDAAEQAAIEAACKFAAEQTISWASRRMEAKLRQAEQFRQIQLSMALLFKPGKNGRPKRLKALDGAQAASAMAKAAEQERIVLEWEPVTRGTGPADSGAATADVLDRARAALGIGRSSGDAGGDQGPGPA